MQLRDGGKSFVLCSGPWRGLGLRWQSRCCASSPHQRRRPSPSRRRNPARNFLRGARRQGDRVSARFGARRQTAILSAGCADRVCVCESRHAGLGDRPEGQGEADKASGRGEHLPARRQPGKTPGPGGVDCCFANTSSRTASRSKSLSRLRPWTVAVMVIALEFKKAGFEAEHGVDMHFAERARARRSSASRP